ncbi:MAG: transporter substrate-binding domain-containing protein, partial [Candidatus Hodarchaeota archaeon]
MRKKIILIFLIIYMFMLLYPSTGTFSSNQPNQIIRVGAYENYPKVFTDDEGNIKGIFPEILNYIASEEGWIINYIHGNWTQCLDRLENGQIDIMVDVGFSQARAEKYDFANESVFNNWGTVYASRGSNIQSLLDLDGKKVAVMKGSIHTEEPQGIKTITKEFEINCTFIETESYTDVFELLNNQEADAGVVNRLFGHLFEKDYNVEKTSIIFNPVELRFAFPKNASLNPLLIERIDYHLANLKADKTSLYYYILNKYLDVRIEVFPEWISVILYGGVILLILFFSIIIVSRIQVNRKTSELQKAYGELEDRVKERTAELQKTVGALEEENTVRRKTEQALQKERNTAQLYLDIAGALILALDENGYITLVNKKGCEILGYKEDELLGKNWFDVCVPEEERDERQSEYLSIVE